MDAESPMFFFFIALVVVAVVSIIENGGFQKWMGALFPASPGAAPAQSPGTGNAPDANATLRTAASIFPASTASATSSDPAKNTSVQ